jgi:hypothetical protein
MKDKKFIFESNSTEIYILLKENSFEDVWESIKIKINNTLKEIDSQEEAISFIKTNLVISLWMD